MTDRSRSNLLAQGWLVFLLCLFFGGSLSAVQMNLAPLIEENKKNEIFRVIPELMPDHSNESSSGAVPYTIRPFLVESGKEGRKITYSVFEASREGDGAVSGWAVRASGQGYADRIELILGLSPEADIITGLFILDQKETPGLGNKISDKLWRDQFVGRKTGEAISARKGKAMNENEIDAVTGATISSVSVCRIVNQAVGDVKTTLQARRDGMKPPVP